MNIEICQYLNMIMNIEYQVFKYQYLNMILNICSSLNMNITHDNFPDFLDGYMPPSDAQIVAFQSTFRMWLIRLARLDWNIRLSNVMTIQEWWHMHFEHWHTRRSQAAQVSIYLLRYIHITIFILRYIQLFILSIYSPIHIEIYAHIHIEIYAY